MEESGNDEGKLKRQPPPTEKEELLLDDIVKKNLGEQATGQFMGVMSRGVRGDEGHYGHAIFIIDPAIVDYRDAMGTYHDRLALTSQEITNQIEIAGNVAVDLSFLFSRPPRNE